MEGRTTRTIPALTVHQHPARKTSAPTADNDNILKAQFDKFGEYLMRYSDNRSPEQRALARSKLRTMHPEEMYALSTDVYDELSRRTDAKRARSSPPHEGFSPERKRLRQRLAALRANSFGEICTDVYVVLKERHSGLSFRILPLFPNAEEVQFVDGKASTLLDPGNRNGNYLTASQGFNRRIQPQIVEVTGGNGDNTQDFVKPNNTSLNEVLANIRKYYEDQIATMQVQITKLNHDLRDAAQRQSRSDAKVRRLEEALANRINTQGPSHGPTQAQGEDGPLSHENPSTVIKDPSDNSQQLKNGQQAQKTEKRKTNGKSNILRLVSQPSTSNLGMIAFQFTPNGGVKDIHISAYQHAVRRLLAAGRTGQASQQLLSWKVVRVAVASIIEDIKAYSQQRPEGKVNLDTLESLQTKAEVTLGVLTMVCTAQVSNPDIAPELDNLLDATVSHMSATILDIVRTISVRKASEVLYTGPDRRDKLLWHVTGYESPLSITQYSSASSRTQTTDYGRYVRRMALSMGTISNPSSFNEDPRSKHE